MVQLHKKSESTTIPSSLYAISRLGAKQEQGPTTGYVERCVLVLVRE